MLYHLYKFQKQAKLIYAVRNQNVVTPGVLRNNAWQRYMSSVDNVVSGSG